MAGFRPLFPVPSGADTFVPLHSREAATAEPGADGFAAGFRPLVPGRLGAEKVQADAAPTQEPPADGGPGDGAEVVEEVEAELAPDPVEEAPEPVEAAPAEEDISQVLAREEGFELGRAEGLEQGRQEIAEQLEKLESLAATVESLRREIFERTVTDVAAAVTHIATAVVRRELRVDSTGVEALVIDVLDHVQADDDVLIRVAPEDLRQMQGAAPRLLELLGRDASFRIDSDPGLSPGGATIETQLGAIDASVETRFEAFASEVAEWALEEVSDASR